MLTLLILPAAVVVSFALTALIQRYANSRQLVDVPNHRSSHKVPTPRGGGVAIVLTMLGSLAVWSIFSTIHQPLIMTVCIGGSWVAFVGLVDDHRHVRAGWRLLAQAFGVICALYWLGGAPVSVFVKYAAVPQGLAYFLAGICVLWCVNLYNFMDGIDGIASIEAITVCGGGVLLNFCGVADSDFWIVPAVLAASVTGFLFWNFPPARIFMGDTGSGFLGYMMAVFLLFASGMSLELTSAWIILLAIFFVDATYTLMRRLVRREKIAQAHRSHAYQLASRLFDSHAAVSLAIGAINVLFLLPVALLVATGWLPWAIGILSAYVPILGLAIWFNAGVSESQARQ